MPSLNYGFLTAFYILSLALLGIATPARRQATTLKAAAGSRYFGAALAASRLSNSSDPKFAQFAKEQFSSATPENEMKWAATEQSQGVFTFEQGDQIASFAASNNMFLRGHALVWHIDLPGFVSVLNGDDLRNAMNKHISTVMKHFKGRTVVWDVVNEAFNDDGTLRPTPFLDKIGSDYIKTAFKTAREADPKAKLYINDYSIEWISAKSDALLETVKSLKSADLIDGVGFQSHFAVGELPQELQQNLQRFADVGVDVAITELDVRMPLPANEANLQQQAKDYASVAKACKAVSRCVGISTWGISDRYTWVPMTFPGQGAALLFDDNYKEKPAFSATIDALSG